MRLHKSQLLLLVFMILFAFKPVAQQITQLGISNYGMLHSLHLNPSFTAYTKYQWHINLAGFWVNANNNYLSLQVPYSLYRIPNRIPQAYQTESGNPTFNKNWLIEHLNGKPKHISVSSDIYGPSASFKVKTWSFGIFTQAAAAVRVTKLPESLAHAIVKEFDSAQGAYNQFNAFGSGKSNVFNAFSISGNSRVNLGINVAKTIKLEWGRELLVGVNVKKVWGAPGFYLHSDGLQAKAVNQDSIVFSESNMELITYGEKTGRGWGSDLGATYVFHKKAYKRHGLYAKHHQNYYCKIGFSILDLGRIKYRGANFNRVQIPDGTGVLLNESFRTDISNNSNYQAVLDTFMNQFGNYSQSTGNINVGLPTRVVTSADFQIRKHFYLAGVVSQSLRKKMSIHNRYQSFVMISPRLEYKYFEVSLPVLQEYDYRSFRMGLSMRFGPLYIGTNNLVSFINSRVIKDADIFAGIAFGNLSEFSFRKLAKNKKHRKARSKQNCGQF